MPSGPGLSSTKHEDNILNLSICNRTLQALLHVLKKFGDGKLCQLILEILQVFGVRGLKLMLEMTHQDAFNFFRILNYTPISVLELNDA